MFLRVVVMVRLVNSSLAAVLGLPLGLIAAGGVLVSLGFCRKFSFMPL
jgi:hypothetical protein